MYELEFQIMAFEFGIHGYEIGQLKRCGDNLNQMNGTEEKEVQSEHTRKIKLTFRYLCRYYLARLQNIIQ